VVDTAIFTHNNDTTSVHGIEDTTALATKTYADGAVSTHSADTTGVHGIANTADLATKSYADSAVSTHSADTTSVHGIADTAELATKTYADGAASSAVSTHSSDTTSIHGIADTAELATKAYADAAASSAAASAASTHEADTLNVHGIADTSALATTTATASAISTAVSDHNSDTTNVHGISDTSLLVTTTGTQTLTGKTLTSPKINEDVAVTATATELNYVDGVTSAIQTQLDAKASSTDLSSHATDTTSIHGISDTAQLAYLNAANQTFTGNMEVDGNVVVDGNFTVNGTNFSASATSITIEDNMVQLAHQNAANTVDLGLVVAYTDGTAKHAGIVRDVSDSKWKLFKDVATEPATTVAFGEGSLDDLALNNLTAAGVVFTDGTQTKEGIPSRTPIIQKTASYTLSALTERDSLIEMSSSSAMTLTIPTDATLNFPIGTSLDILQTSTGQVTIAGAGGVTVNSTPGLKLRTTWSSATLFKRAADTWVVYGDLMA